MNEFCKDKSHVNHFWEWKKETNDRLIPGINYYYKLIQLQDSKWNAKNFLFRCFFALLSKYWSAGKSDWCHCNLQMYKLHVQPVSRMLTLLLKASFSNIVLEGRGWSQVWLYQWTQLTLQRVVAYGPITITINGCVWGWGRRVDGEPCFLFWHGSLL